VKKIIYLVLLFFGMSVISYANPIIAVIDFDSGSWCTLEEAQVMTDAFRNEIIRSKKADVVTRNRLEALKTEIRFQMTDWADPTRIKQAGSMLGADYMIFGRLSVLSNKTGNLQVEMIDVETSRVIHASRITLSTWLEFERKVNTFAKEFIGKFPTENIFTGSWTATVLNDGKTDSYTITFITTNRCALKITSNVDGADITEEAQGNYSLADDILKINANFKNSLIPNIGNIQWTSVISISGDNMSFNMLITPTSVSPNQVRVTFYKE